MRSEEPLGNQPGRYFSTQAAFAQYEDSDDYIAFDNRRDEARTSGHQERQHLSVPSLESQHWASNPTEGRPAARSGEPRPVQPDFFLDRERYHALLCQENFWRDSCPLSWEECLAKNHLYHAREPGSHLEFVDMCANLSQLKDAAKSLKLPANCTLYVNDVCNHADEWGYVFEFASPNIRVARSMGLHARTKYPEDFFPKAKKFLAKVYTTFQMGAFGYIGVDKLNKLSYDLGDLIDYMMPIINDHQRAGMPLMIHSTSFSIEDTFDKLDRRQITLWRCKELGQATALEREEMARTLNRLDHPGGVGRPDTNSDLHSLIKRNICFAPVFGAHRYPAGGHGPSFSCASGGMSERIVFETGCPSGRPNFVCTRDSRTYDPLCIVAILLNYHVQYMIAKRKESGLFQEVPFYETVQRVTRNSFRYIPRSVFELNPIALRRFIKENFGKAIERYGREIRSLAHAPTVTYVCAQLPAGSGSPNQGRHPPESKLYTVGKVSQSPADTYRPSTSMQAIARAEASDFADVDEEGDAAVGDPDEDGIAESILRADDLNTQIRRHSEQQVGPLRAALEAELSAKESLARELVDARRRATEAQTQLQRLTDQLHSEREVKVAGRNPEAVRITVTGAGATLSSSRPGASSEARSTTASSKPPGVPLETRPTKPVTDTAGASSEARHRSSGPGTPPARPQAPTAAQPALADYTISQLESMLAAKRSSETAKTADGRRTPTSAQKRPAPVSASPPDGERGAPSKKPHEPPHCHHVPRSAPRGSVGVERPGRTVSPFAKPGASQSRLRASESSTDSRMSVASEDDSAASITRGLDALAADSDRDTTTSRSSSRSTLASSSEQSTTHRKPFKGAIRATRKQLDEMFPSKPPPPGSSRSKPRSAEHPETARLNPVVSIVPLTARQIAAHSEVVAVRSSTDTQHAALAPAGRKKTITFTDAVDSLFSEDDTRPNEAAVAPKPSVTPGGKSTVAPKPSATPSNESAVAPKPSATPSSESAVAPRPSATPGSESAVAPRPSATPGRSRMTIIRKSTGEVLSDTALGPAVPPAVANSGPGLSASDMVGASAGAPLETLTEELVFSDSSPPPASSEALPPGDLDELSMDLPSPIRRSPRLASRQGSPAPSTARSPARSPAKSARGSPAKPTPKPTSPVKLAPRPSSPTRGTLGPDLPTAGALGSAVRPSSPTDPPSKPASPEEKPPTPGGYPADEGSQSTVDSYVADMTGSQQ